MILRGQPARGAAPPGQLSQKPSFGQILPISALSFPTRPDIRTRLTALWLFLLDVCAYFTLLSKLFYKFPYSDFGI
jgi:hypothetical protein